MSFRGLGLATATASAAIFLAGCATQPEVAKTSGPSDELSKALKEAATRAVEVRLRQSAMQAVPTTAYADLGADQAVPSTARIDIDYVGPVENATRLLARRLGWEFNVAGKKRSEVIVSLRHEQQDSVTILRDIGTQCGQRCDVHVEVVEGGKSSVALSYRD